MSYEEDYYTVRAQRDELLEALKSVRNGLALLATEPEDYKPEQGDTHLKQSMDWADTLERIASAAIAKATPSTEQSGAK